MKLWIRSQDKTQLGIIVGVILVDNELRGFTNYNQNYFELGTYKTKERALEVLDEIQKYIIPTLNLLDDTLKGKQVCQVGNILSMVYEMPKE